MKIERISDNQIKCTLNRSDLASRQLKLSELAYGTEKAKGLFQDMMEQANLEFGFDASDIPLMIEAIPVSMDCIILMITKVEDPEEVDTRLSSFLNLKDLFSAVGPAEEDSESSEGDLLSPGSLLQLQDLAEKLHQSRQSSPEKLFSFKDLNTVISLAHHLRPLFSGTSTLYKSPENSSYYLHLCADTGSGQAFSHVCDLCAEFGSRETLPNARTAFMDEHFDVLLSGSAIEHLAEI